MSTLFIGLKSVRRKNVPVPFWHHQKIAENVGDLGKIIGATGFEKLPKAQ